MQSELGHTGMDERVDGVESVWQQIRQTLEAEKQRIFQEIRHYPPPIPACDVQFNSLLAERSTILQEIGRVDSMLKQGLTGEATCEMLNEFIQTSRCVNDEFRESIRQSLRK